MGAVILSFQPQSDSEIRKAQARQSQAEADLRKISHLYSMFQEQIDQVGNRRFLNEWHH